MDENVKNHILNTTSFIFKYMNLFRTYIYKNNLIFSDYVIKTKKILFGLLYEFIYFININSNDNNNFINILNLYKQNKNKLLKYGDGYELIKKIKVSKNFIKKISGNEKYKQIKDNNLENIFKLNIKLSDFYYETLFKIIKNKLLKEKKIIKKMLKK